MIDTAVLTLLGNAAIVAYLVWLHVRDKAGDKPAKK